LIRLTVCDGKPLQPSAFSLHPSAFILQLPPSSFSYTRRVGRDRTGVGGWLLLLCVLLVAGEPVSLALSWSATVLSIVERGPAAFVLAVARLLAVALGLSAGLALWRLKPHGVLLARVYLIAAPVPLGISLAFDILPGQPPPDVAGPIFAMLVAHNVAWLAYLRLSSRVRRTYS
jgi:hypothetical protein